MTEPEGRTFANVPTETLYAWRRRAWIESARSWTEYRHSPVGIVRDILRESAETAEHYYHAVDAAYRARLADRTAE